MDSREVDGGTRILIRGSSTPTFTVYKLDRPSRVVVDIASSRLAVPDGDDKGVWSINSWAVGEISAHPLGSAGASVTRVVVGLARPGTYKVKAVGNDVLIIVTARDAAPVNADPAATKRAEADARAARADAAKARRDADATSAVAARQIADAKAATADAARQIADAKAEAERAQRELAAAKARAEAAVDRAQADARAATVAAAARDKDAKARMARAAATLAEADKRMAEASSLSKRARAADAKAQAALSEAAAQQQQASKAQELAEQRRVEADRAAKAAERYRAEAAAARGDGSKAESLRRRAEQAARDAETRRERAEQAAKVAEQRRVSAESAATEAERRRQAADVATRTATAERERADEQRSIAENETQRARAERLAAEKRRVAAEAAAAEAGKRADVARALRQKEELAYQRAASARAEAEKRRTAAETAGTTLEQSIARARTAQQTAADRRSAAAAARRKADDAQRRTASAAAIAKARAEAERLEALLAVAEKDLGVRQQQVAKNRTEVRRLEERRDTAAAELGKLRSLAEDARGDRRTEEAKLAELLARRAEEERQLEAANKARVEAERRAARAEQQARAAGDRASSQVAAEARAKAEAEAATARAAAANAAASKAASTAATKAAAEPEVRVRDVAFTDRPREARITIALSAPTRPRVIGGAGNKRIIELDDATIPQALERTLDTSKYDGPVKSVSSYRVPKQPDKVRVVVELNENTRSRLRRVGNDYHWEFRKSEAVASKSTPRRAQSIPTPVIGGYGSASTPIQQQTVAQVASQRSRVYRGTKIDLDFRDADIHNLLRLLADVGGVNIVIPDEIKYKVTVRMRRVPWDQALEVILASKGLWYERNGNLYRIAPRKELDLEAQAEAERRAAMVQSEVPRPDYVTLNYSTAKEVEKQIRPMLSPRGQLQIDERTNTVVVIDVKANRENIANLLSRLDTPTPQIQIEARIVEARSTFLREIGVQWGGNAIGSAATGNATGLVFPNSVGVAGGADDNQTNSTGVRATPSDFAVNLPAAVGTGSGGALGFALGSVGGNFNLNLRLSALEDQGTVRIVSAPKITVVNNITASISQGVSIPVSVISANGVQTQFVPADLALEVTPTVSQRDCAVSLDVKVKKNEADFVNTGARGDPTILRKEAQTRILVADGATTVIGGIYTRNTGLAYSKVPFFGDLPVFGWFFKSRRENDERTEVLVFITPKITNKASLRCE
ncbi:MAG TPA: type IV pilus secretin PilQ [Kofleriaceae bacterium]|nr:type IV pilus secretin PilQ [Kofleriaceae bacterium]